MRAHLQRMHRSGRAVWIASATLLCAPCLVVAQQAAAPPAPSPGRNIPTPDQLEPGVSTTPAATSTAPAAPAPSAAPVAPAAPATAGTSPAPTSTVAPPASATPPAERQASVSAKPATRKGPDRLELDATDITGNRELPKVLYIVPWKRSDLGDVVGRPVNSLLDEVLQPLDRDVFQRENRYYDSLKTGAGDAKAGAAQGSPNKP